MIGRRDLVRAIVPAALLLATSLALATCGHSVEGDRATVEALRSGGTAGSSTVASPATVASPVASPTP
jgi:hypothetical protein